MTGVTVGVVGIERQDVAVGNNRVDIHPNAILAKTGLLKRQVAQRLLDLAPDGDKRSGIVERRAIERGELAQELASAQRLGARKGRNGVERVEQEVRVDLSLQRAHLGTGGELGLQLELMDGKLRGNELGKTGSQRILGTVDLVRAPIVELERSHSLAAYLERGDDARRDLAMPAGLALHVHGVREALHDAMLKNVMRGGRMDWRAGRKIARKVACAGEHARIVRHRDGHGSRLSKQPAANCLGALGGQAVLDILQHLRSRRKRLLGVLRAKDVGIKGQEDENQQECA